jgi:hypothetical protein
MDKYPAMQSNDPLPTSRITATICHEDLFIDFSKTDLLTCDGKMAMLVVYTKKLSKYHPAASTKGRVTCHAKQWPTPNKWMFAQLLFYHEYFGVTLAGAFLE